MPKNRIFWLKLKCELKFFFPGLGLVGTREILFHCSTMDQRAILSSTVAGPEEMVVSNGECRNYWKLLLL